MLVKMTLIRFFKVEAFRYTPKITQGVGPSRMSYVLIRAYKTHSISLTLTNRAPLALRSCPWPAGLAHRPYTRRAFELLTGARNGHFPFCQQVW